MDNGTNISKEQINSILNKAKELSSEGKTPDSAFLNEQLGSEQTEKLQRILSNPDKLREVMNSPMAKRLMAMLQSKDKE